MYDVCAVNLNVAVLACESPNLYSFLLHTATANTGFDKDAPRPSRPVPVSRPTKPAALAPDDTTTKRVLDTLIRDGADVHKQNKFKNTPHDVANSVKCRGLLREAEALPAPSAEQAENMHANNLQVRV